MNDQEVKKHFKAQLKIAKKHDPARLLWKRHTLLLASTLFGVLISLHGKSEHVHIAHLIHSVALVLLSLGILSLAASLYSRVDEIARLRADHTNEGISALRQGRPSNVVTSDERKIFSFFEKLGYIFLLSSMLLLCSYAILI